MGDNVKPIKNVKIYNWQQGLQYEMDNTEINYAKKFGEIVNHFIRKNIREARISSPKFCLELQR